MEVIVTADYDEMSAVAGEIVIGAIRRKPNIVLGLATGGTPEGLYAALIEAHKRQGLDFSRVVTFNLDEYVGISPDHEQSYRHFMDSHLFDHINIKRKNTHVPDGLAENLTDYCEQYERMIQEAGGIDLQVLGIGRDGHLGFNEPGTSLASRTQVVTLARETIEDNSRYFESEDEVPKFAITMGVHTILGARLCLMVANGEGKADAVKRCVEGPIAAMCTASALQMHPNAVVVVDEAAASKLERLDYYKWVQQLKGQLAGKM
jgi:glucosamine-6-phosphate deaminase